MKKLLIIPIAFLAIIALFTGCKKEPTACFTFSSESIEADEPALVNETIKFTNCSEEANSYEWDFGDDKSSTSANPSHSYKAPGIYTVSLTATNDDGTNTVSLEIEITLPSPTACFTFTSASISNGKSPEAGEKILFDDCSVWADTYEWNFGDGNTSTFADPEHTYAAAGTYTVIFTVTNSSGSNSTSQVIVVVEPAPSITGTWDGTMTLSGDIFDFTFEIEQNGSELDGTFVFSDGSGYTHFGSNSKITGQNVNIDFTETVYGMHFVFTGTLNDDFDKMSGNVVISLSAASLTGPWSASKISRKKSTVPFNGKGLDTLIKHLKQ